MATAADLLTEVNAAISACLQAKAYVFNGRAVTRADLSDLREFRRELLVEIQDSANGGQMASLIEIDPPV